MTQFNFLNVLDNILVIDANAIQAAAHCAASKDLRSYLNGVYIKIKHGDKATIAGTDGHALFVGLANLQTATPSGDTYAWVNAELIIPLDTIKKLDKKQNIYQLRYFGDNQFVIGGQVFTPLEGKYPDIGRVIPTHDQITAEEQKPAVFDPDLLTRAQKALQTYYSAKKDTTYALYQRGDNSAIMHAGENCAQVIVMPIRAQYAANQGNVQGFNRDYL